MQASIWANFNTSTFILSELAPKVSRSIYVSMANTVTCVQIAINTLYFFHDIIKILHAITEYDFEYLLVGVGMHKRLDMI